MTDLSDLFKVVAQGKHQKESIKVESKPVDLSDLFKVVNDGIKEKNNNPIIKEVKENIKKDVSALFDSLKEVKQEENRPKPKPKKKNKYVQVIPEVKEDSVLTPELKKIFESQKTVKQASEELSLEDIKKKIVLMENAITRLASHGPGSGEVNLRNLDDIDRASIGDNKFIKYNATTKKFEFVTISGVTPPEEEMQYSKRIDFISDNELYKGEAAVGAAEGSAVWRIRKVLIGADGDVTEIFADGDANFDNIWANHLSLNYL